MTVEVIFVLILVLVAVILFATEKLPVDLVALLILALLLVTGIITPEQGVSGFSNTATVTVGAMFILSAGLFQTGAVNQLGAYLGKIAQRSHWLGLLAIMVTVAVVSAFINNTAAVAIFIPVVISVSQSIGINAAKLLMPLSFASMFGGACTLIGTSTNILVSSIAEEKGLAPLGMFELMPFGIIITVVGIVYMFTVGVRLIPNRRAEELTVEFEITNYLTEIVILSNSSSVGKPLFKAPLVVEQELAILQVVRGGKVMALPSRRTVIAEGDILRVRCSLDKIKTLNETPGISLTRELQLSADDLESENIVLVEAVIAPNSELEGKTLKDVNFRNTFGAIAIALRHKGQVLYDKLSYTRLTAGDVLLISVNRDRLDGIRQNPAFLFINEVSAPKYRKKRLVHALVITTAVVLVAALNIMPIMVSAIIGCVLMILTGCLTMDEAYGAIQWRVLFLLAGVLSLGIALENSGGAELIGSVLINSLGSWGPRVVLSALFFTSFMLTNVMSNNATAALLAPIAIVTANSMGVDSRPLLMAVTFAASLSFMTPVGYQTNTMIYGVGQYRFSDFLRVGTPLNLIFWILGTVFIPVFWPF